MTNEEQFDECMRQAAQIVSMYRAQAPKGCDPQNTWVAVAVAAVGVGVSAYSANEQKNATKKAAANTANAAQMQPFEESTPFPQFIPANIGGPGGIEDLAKKNDINAYQLSDADFRQRHGKVVGAENSFQDQLKKDWAGNSEFIPQLQSTSIQSGLEKATGSMGPINSNLAPSSGAEADVAKNLGLDVLNFQQLNRQNRMGDLSLAETIFPRRQIGINGADAAAISLANTAGENNQNQASYQAKLAQDQQNYLSAAQNRNALTQQQNANAQANAQANAAIWGSVASGIGTAAGAYGRDQAANAAGVGQGGYYGTQAAAQKVYGDGVPVAYQGPSATNKSSGWYAQI